MRGMIRHAAALSTLLAAFSLTTTAQTPDLDGAALYQQRCASCHGRNGRGDGEYAGLLNPRPRDFTSGRFKFRSTDIGKLPTDDDLARSIADGLHGTSMPAEKLRT